MAVPTLLLAVACVMTSSFIAASSACPVRECSCEDGRNGVIVDCRNKNFDKVPDFEAGTQNYYELKLSGNLISVIPGKAFKKLNVEKIDLSNNPIRKISDVAFEGLETQLKELIIEAKSVTPIKFPPRLLYSLETLEEVKIKGFDMPVLEHGLFVNSKNLQRLTLENCKIITIFPTAFQGLQEKLALLDLSNNKLTSVPIAELRPLVNLNKLVLAQNRITTIQANSFLNLSNLIDLDLSQNSIQKIESAAFSGLEQNLEYLGLHANMISQTSLLAIANLVKLEQLNLAYNLFGNTLPDFTFKSLNKLAYLNLQGNRLTAISPATFEGLGESLGMLILSENKLTTLPDEGFRHLENLKWLYLDLMNLGGSFSQHTFHGLENTLEYLTLENVNFMNEDLKSVHYLKELKTLNLCQNHVNRLPDGTFTSLNKLEQLTLCHNNIGNITQGSLQGLETSLQVLSLEGNDIETIDHCTLKSFAALRELSLDGNPLNCDCRLTWLRDWIEKQNDITKMAIGWKCSRPINHMDRLLKHVAPQDLICAENVEEKCIEFVKATATTDVPHAHIEAARVTDNSVSLTWAIDDKRSVVGVRLFYKMTDNETYSYTLLLNPTLSEYTIHDLYSETNYTICIGLDLKLGQNLPDEECITVRTERLGVRETYTGEKPLPLYVIISGGVGGLVFLLLVVVVAIQVCRWRRRTNRAKSGLYDTPWVTSRPQAPSLSTLPSRRSDFENPMRHYYSRPLSCGTVHTVSSNLPRSNSMATALDSEYGGHYRPHGDDGRSEYGGSAYKRAQSMDLNVYDMDRCLYKIDHLMASANNILQHPTPKTRIPPPYQGESLYSDGVRAGYHPDLPAYPAQVSEYPTRVSYPPKVRSPEEGFQPQGVFHTDLSSKTASLRDSGHISGFPSYTSGFDELEPPPIEHQARVDQSRVDQSEAESRDQAARSQQDPLPPPPAYLLDETVEIQPDDRIYDEIYTIY